MAIDAIRIKQLAFTGSTVKTEKINFSENLNLIYGASNTGKSYLLTVLDFMFGKEQLKKSIPEREKYEKVWLSLELSEKETITLARSFSGGNFELYKGITDGSDKKTRVGILGGTSKTKNSLSDYLLGFLKLEEKKIATNKSGEKENLSFRHIAGFSLVDEGSIMREGSPIETGDRTSWPKERRVFRLMLTGLDDSSIVEVQNPKKFAAFKAARIEVVTDMLSHLNAVIGEQFDENENLSKTINKLNDRLVSAQAIFSATEISLADEIAKKADTGEKILQIRQRINEINLHTSRFDKLREVYSSDIERLESIEEAGFYLQVEERRCSICGTPKQQQANEGIDIDKIRIASEAEVMKIMKQQNELEKTIFDLKDELTAQSVELEYYQRSLNQIDKTIAGLLPEATQGKESIERIISERDRAMEGLRLYEQRNTLVQKLNEFSNQKQPSKSARPVLDISQIVINEFCLIISEVLTAWGFPGQNFVTFDLNLYDIYIDGKLRTSNGKGIRAITHAAFKVAILIFCRRKGLPHPGFIVLDSPLVTYRDPLKNPKMGDLSEDEKTLKKSNLKEMFFSHLHSISDLGQFIILENIDPPADVSSISNIEIFYGDSGSGRYGLFPSLD